ncbi:HNH endonuclease [Bdellovibrio sp. HCB117]|uniref:HNH endonuclease n=1 Tax=Bdellovibrio sp. HCB117 TaxID=3394359 RepID=UPI0039B56B22
MSISKMTNNELDSRIKTLASNERKLLKSILFTISEIDGRRSYLELGYPSLFDYLTKEVGYSGGSAQRRIDAARILREIPETAEKIESGEIKLNQISMLQRAAREVAKERNVEVSAHDKKELLSQIANRGHEETQKEIASYFDLPVIEAPVSKVQADESVRLEFTLTKEQYEKLKQAQALLAHSSSSSDIPNFIEHICDKIITQKTKVRPLKNENADESSNDASVENFVTATVAVSNRVKKLMLAKQPCCQFKIPSTGKICGSTWLLQVDHIQPRWSGGDNSLENLQVLCAQHNRLKYRMESGLRFR